jgi:3'(2'), 5'-bisphosphate nucleotidase
LKIKNIPISYPDAEFLIGAALAASEKIEEVYKKDFGVEFKDGKEPVTLADKEADLIITRELRKRFPADRIFSEENGLDVPKKHNQRTWYIDPVDGTREFIKKNGEFAIQIGLADGNRLEFGLVYQPIGKNLYIAARNEGCWWHTPGQPWKKLEIDKNANDNEVVLVISRSKPSKTGKKIHDAIGGTGMISHGGVGLKLMAIAKGHGDYYINCSNATKAWDMAGPELLFLEAGGVTSQFDGSPFSYDPKDYRHKKGLLASSSRQLHQKILDCLNKLF